MISPSLRAISMAAKDICVPGQRICHLDENIVCGQGTYDKNGFVYSSRAGYLHKLQSQDSKILFEVRKNVETTTVPSIDALVTARITNVTPRFCKCAILSVGRTLLRETFRGQIRKEDVRATEKDKIIQADQIVELKPVPSGEVFIALTIESLQLPSAGFNGFQVVTLQQDPRLVEMYKCFRPGDIVVARVISLGDAQSYVLSTAENELGVVIATSEAGSTMVPISWCKMQCPKSLAEEFRKVAKVQPQFIQYSGT